jgi:4-amino-4-deoxy-L-arabinose transferase-like glycosyltransferase
LLVAILLAYVPLALLYSAATPLWEAPDEPSHYLYVEYLAVHGALPSPAPAQRGRFYEYGYVTSLYEWYQLPLYYALVAPPVAAANALSPGCVPQQFPPVNPEFPRAVRLFNADLPQVFCQAPGPCVARLLSIVLGVLTLLATYRLALAVAPGRETAALTATGFMAFIPQFTFLTGYVTNDNLADLLGAVCVLACVDLLGRHGAHAQRRVLGVGLLAALALVTKLSLLFVLPLGWLVLALRAWRVRSAAQGAREAALFTGAAVSLLVGGFVLLPGVRAQLAYAVKVLEPQAGHLSLAYVASLWPLTHASFWGRFGWMNVSTPDWTASALDLVALVGLAGSIALLRTREIRPGALLLLWVACGLVVIAFIRFNLSAFQPQGRLLYPALAAFAVLVALGWGRLARRWSGWVGLGVVLLTLITNLACLFGALVPAYGALNYLP